jgi:hypothetical protein
MISESVWVSPVELNSIPKPRSTRLSKTGKTTLAGLGFAFLISVIAYGLMFSINWPRHKEFQALQRDG